MTRPLVLAFIAFQPVGVVWQTFLWGVTQPVPHSRVLEPWQDPLYLASGVPLQGLHPDCTIYVDASNHGWEAHMNDMELCGVWTKEEFAKSWWPQTTCQSCPIWPHALPLIASSDPERNAPVPWYQDTCVRLRDTSLHYKNILWN
jgi:hypothetical protein